MTGQRVLDFLTRSIINLGIPGVSDQNFALPNVEFDISGKDLVFELNVSELEEVQETEHTTTTQGYGTIVISGLYGEGTGRLDAIANAICEAFSITNPRQVKAFRESKPIFGWNLRRKNSRAYITGAKRSEIGVEEGRCKVTVTVNFEIFEES